MRRSDPARLALARRAKTQAETRYGIGGRLKKNGPKPVSLAGTMTMDDRDLVRRLQEQINSLPEGGCLIIRRETIAGIAADPISGESGWSLVLAGVIGSALKNRWLFRRDEAGNLIVLRRRRV